MKVVFINVELSLVTSYNNKLAWVDLSYKEENKSKFNKKTSCKNFIQIWLTELKKLHLMWNIKS